MLSPISLAPYLPTPLREATDFMSGGRFLGGQDFFDPRTGGPRFLAATFTCAAYIIIGGLWCLWSVTHFWRLSRDARMLWFGYVITMVNGLSLQFYSGQKVKRFGR